MSFMLTIEQKWKTINQKYADLKPRAPNQKQRVERVKKIVSEMDSQKIDIEKKDVFEKTLQITSRLYPLVAHRTLREYATSALASYRLLTLDYEKMVQ